MGGMKKPTGKQKQDVAKIQAAVKRVAPTRSAFASLVARANKSKNNPTSW
jgi:hypothetical protein